MNFPPSIMRTAAVATLLLSSQIALQTAHAAGSYFSLGAGNTVSGVSANGSVAASYDGSSYSMWTAASGLQSIGGAWEGGVASVSANGQSISGSSVGSNGLIQAAVYNVATGGWTPMGGIGGSSGTAQSSAWGLSGNGSTVVGLGWIDGGSAHAVASTAAGTLTDLGSIGGNSRANGISADGSVITGWVETADGTWAGAYWRNGSLTQMVDGNGNALSEGNAVSGNGTWIVGSANSGTDTWRYNTLTGTTQSLGDFNPLTFVQAATGLSADGHIIVGYDRGFGPARFGIGTIWVEGQGMMSLTTYVTDHGVDLNGRTLALPMGVSADGNTFYGMDNTGSGFVVTISAVPEPASALMLMLGVAGLATVVRRRNRTESRLK